MIYRKLLQTELAIAAGIEPKYYPFSRSKSIVATTTPLDVHDGFVDMPTLNGSTLYIRSTNAADTNIEVEVVGLDADLIPQRVRVVLNGTNIIELPSTWSRVSQMYNTSGLNDSATPIAKATLGDVQLGNSNLSVAYLKFLAADQFVSSGAITVPSNMTLFLKALEIKTSKASGTETMVDINLMVRSPGGVWMTVLHDDLSSNGDDNILQLPNGFPTRLDSGTDMKIRVVTDSQTAVFVVKYSGILIDNQHINKSKNRA